MQHLVKIVHEHIEYVGELLFELQEQSLSSEQLIQRAKTYYGLELNSSELSRRMQLFKDAELVKMNRHKIYVLTEEGARFTETLKLENKSNAENNTLGDITKKSEEVQENVKLKCDDRILDYSRLIKMILKSLDRAKSDSVTNGELYIRDLYMIIKIAKKYRKI